MGGGQGGGEGEGVGSLFRYNFRCHPGCCVVIRTLSSALYTYFIRTFGESEPICREFEALSPMIHTLRVLQVPYTGKLPENHRESEPYSHETVALSPELRRQASLPEYTTSGGLRRLKIKHCAELIAAARSCLAVTVPSPQMPRRPLLR